MKRPSRTGIGGILDQLLSADTRPRSDQDDLRDGAPAPPNSPNPDEYCQGDPRGQARIRTRRGRPPGTAKKPHEPKEKVTVWITRSMIAHYRDWTWEARCQLSRLVEQALADYHNRNRTQRPFDR
jgi:hypothetical protein